MFCKSLSGISCSQSLTYLWPRIVIKFGFIIIYMALWPPINIWSSPMLWCITSTQVQFYKILFRIEYPTSETLSQFQDACFFLHTHKRRWISGDQRWQLFQVEIFGKSWNNFASYVFCRVMPTKCSSRDLQRKWIIRLKRFRFGLTSTWCKADSTYVHQSILG